MLLRSLPESQFKPILTLIELDKNRLIYDVLLKEELAIWHHFLRISSNMQIYTGKVIKNIPLGLENFQILRQKD